ncbi:MAG: dihydroorotase, partial [Planctomycetes bacterium]|nr:dihydroorotase [Planctomycetota bacterium]
MTHNLFLHGGQLVSDSGTTRADVLVQDGRIAAVGTDLNVPAGTPEFDAKGLLVFPGLIDPQVHFREPGLTHKENIESGSRAALAGGITAFMEMPNTNPLTTDPEALAHKLERARETSFTDYAFFVGGTAENAERLGEYECLPGCAGVKVFMGSSTGNLLVRDDTNLERILRGGKRRVTFHSEDDFRLNDRYQRLASTAKVTEHHHIRDVECAVMATTRLLDLVERTGRPVHILHISTAEELDLVRERDLGDLVTLEATPNHLFLAAPDCYEEHGSHAQMNPPVREKRHQEALRQALTDGTITCIGSDHAPHTLEEKAKPYPHSPSGIPGTQTILPLLLTAVRDGWLKLEDIVRLSVQGPIRVYGIQNRGLIAPGNEAHFSVVAPNITTPLPLDWLESQAGWSPYAGRKLAGLPVATILHGQIAHQHGQPIQHTPG